MSNSHHSKTNQQSYDLWSNQYDHGPNSTIAVDEAHFPQVWSHISGKRILEIGSGTGRHTSRLVKLGCHITAIEISTGMLEIAKAKLKESKVEFIQGDFLSYDKLVPNSFDGILTSLVLEHIEDINSFFKKVASLLNPEGEFFLSEIHPDRIAKGSQANFTDPATGENIRLVSFAHSAFSIAEAGMTAGLTLLSDKDILGDENLAKLYPGWEKHIGKPMIKIWVFKKVCSTV